MLPNQIERVCSMNNAICYICKSSISWQEINAEKTEKHHEGLAHKTCILSKFVSDFCKTNTLSNNSETRSATK